MPAWPNAYGPRPPSIPPVADEQVATDVCLADLSIVNARIVKGANWYQTKIRAPLAKGVK